MCTCSHQMFTDFAGISQPLKDVFGEKSEKKKEIKEIKVFGETATARGAFHNDDRSVLPSPRKIRNTEKEKRNAYEQREIQKTSQNE